MIAPLRKGDIVRFTGGWIRIIDGRAKVKIAISGDVEIDRSGSSIAKEPKKRKDTSSKTK